MRPQSPILLLIAIQAFQLLTLSSSFRLIEKFSDEFLPADQRDGQEIAHLGRVIKLDTIMSHMDPTKMPTRFAIYNRRKSTEDIRFTPSTICDDICQGPFQYDLRKLNDSGYDPKLKTVILISGFRTGDHVSWLDRAKDIWLAIEEANLITVGWKDGAGSFYPRAVANTPLVARQITILLHYLAELNGLKLTDTDFLRRIHFVGHSLGGHVGGFLGQDLGRKLGRITALDPAGPSFDQMPRNRRLDRTDAILVDVIHTNAGETHYGKALTSGIFNTIGKLMSNPSNQTNYEQDPSLLWFGINQQVGDLDLYANGGSQQTGCEGSHTGGVVHLCDHGRSHEIFEDLLRYHYELMQLPSAKADIKESRLMAYRSSDFKDFLTGNNFKKFNCRGVFGSSESIKPCSVPMDLITPVDEFIEELKSDYGIDVFESQYRDDEKFYFKTHPKSPLLADHHLLKIHLGGYSPRWNEKCKFKAKVSMANSRYFYLKLDKFMNLVQNDLFYGLAMPFVAINTIRARDALNEILANSADLSENQITELVYNALPISIQLQITNSNSQSWSLFGKSSDKHSDECYFGIVRVTIQPLMGTKLVASYSTGNASYDNFIVPNEPRNEEPKLLTVEKNQFFKFESLYIGN